MQHYMFFIAIAISVCMRNVLLKKNPKQKNITKESPPPHVVYAGRIDGQTSPHPVRTEHTELTLQCYVNMSPELSSSTYLSTLLFMTLL